MENIELGKRCDKTLLPDSLDHLERWNIQLQVLRIPQLYPILLPEPNAWVRIKHGTCERRLHQLQRRSPVASHVPEANRIHLENSLYAKS